MFNRRGRNANPERLQVGLSVASSVSFPLKDIAANPLLTPVEVMLADGQTQQKRHQHQPGVAPMKEHPHVVVAAAAAAAGRLLEGFGCAQVLSSLYSCLHVRASERERV